MSTLGQAEFLLLNKTLFVEKENGSNQQPELIMFGFSNKK